METEKDVRTFWDRFITFGNMTSGIEHFLAMFPASVLTAIIINNECGEVVLDISLVLFANACGTLIFSLITKGKFPAYLGSSFAYISLTIYLINNFKAIGISSVDVINYVGLAYVFSAVLLFLLSFSFHSKRLSRIIDSLLPNTVIGPAISLIGLELVKIGVQDAKLLGGSVNEKIVAVFTIFAIIFASLIRKKVLNNASIFTGVILGCVLYYVIVDNNFINITAPIYFSLPTFNFIGPQEFKFIISPAKAFGMIITVIPVTMVIISENFSRITIINNILKREVESQSSEATGISFTKYGKDYSTSMRGQSASIMASALMGSVPNTLYAENIAVMNIQRQLKGIDHKYPTTPYYYAVSLSFLCAFIMPLQSLLFSIPKVVIGGVELLLFTIIAAPGIQMIVDSKADYKKISNQLITASVLVAGITGIQINAGIVVLQGMSLGIAIGVLMNMIVKILKRFAMLNEVSSKEEIEELCLREEYNNKKIERVNNNVSEIYGKNTKHWFAKINISEIDNSLKLKMKLSTAKNYAEFDQIDIIEDDEKSDTATIRIRLDGSLKPYYILKAINQSFEDITR